MEPVTISYRIKLSEQVTEVFDFRLDHDTGNLISDPIPDPPAWTALEFKQCSHCPLSAAEHLHCPIALQLYHIVERFHDTASIDEVELRIVTDERNITQTVHLQQAIGSMLGLVSPTCGCPKMAYMKPMARFHLPLSSEEETLFRVAGMYLLAQQLLHKDGIHKNAFIEDEAGFNGLKTIYEDLHILNKALATRLRGATLSDSLKNAIALLDMYSNLVPMMIEDHLPHIKGLFDAYYPGGKIPVSGEAAERKPIQRINLKPKPISIGDKEIYDLLSQADFVSELESLLGSDKKSP